MLAAFGATAMRKEAEFVFWVWPEIPMESIDNFIDGLQCDPDGNRVQIRAEERLALAILRPGALIVGDFNAS
jgi:hypothetical protein